jgi:hypothetical protein
LYFFLANLEEIRELDRRVIGLFVTVYLFIATISLPMISGALYFWGIPFVLFSCFVLNRLTKKIKLEYLINSLALGILLILAFQWLFIFVTHSDRRHIAFEKLNSQKYISKNFMANATLNNKWEIIESDSPFSLNSQKRDMYSYFLIDWGKGLEETIRESNMKGSFFLFGEHDNLNNFIGENSIFKNDSFQQKRPWYISRPVMIRNLWVATLLDPFYCSNLGSTLSASFFLFPKVWVYDKLGLPKILAATEVGKNKIITYFGDSDPIVSFLASYNASFLHALYKQPSKNDLLKIVVLIFILFLSKSIRSERTILIILFLGLGVFVMLSFKDFQKNQNVFDYAVDLRGKIVTPHVENNDDFIINFLSKNGEKVFLGKDIDNVDKAKIIVVPESSRTNVCSQHTKGLQIIFLQENSSVIVGENLIESGSIPLGERIVNVASFKIVVPDARSLKVRGTKKPSIIVVDHRIIIATGSPQRFYSYEDILKCCH